jgi:hypothetical protein
MNDDGRLGGQSLTQLMISNMVTELDDHPLPWTLIDHGNSCHIRASDGHDFGPFGSRSFAERLLADVEKCHKRIQAALPDFLKGFEG